MQNQSSQKGPLCPGKDKYPSCLGSQIATDSSINSRYLLLFVFTVLRLHGSNLNSDENELCSQRRSLHGASQGLPAPPWPQGSVCVCVCVWDEGCVWGRLWAGCDTGSQGQTDHKGPWVPSKQT